MRGGDGAQAGGRHPAGRSSLGAPPLWVEHKAGRTPGQERDRDGQRVRARLSEEDQSQCGDPDHYLGCGGDNGLQRPCRGACGVAGITAGVLCTVVVVVVGGVGGGALKQVLPGRLDLRVEGGRARGGGRGGADRS